MSKTSSSLWSATRPQNGVTQITNSKALGVGVAWTRLTEKRASDNTQLFTQILWDLLLKLYRIPVDLHTTCHLPRQASLSSTLSLKVVRHATVLKCIHAIDWEWHVWFVRGKLTFPRPVVCPRRYCSRSCWRPGKARCTSGWGSCIQAPKRSLRRSRSPTTQVWRREPWGRDCERWGRHLDSGGELRIRLEIDSRSNIHFNV